jgi:hypothetical protein
MPVIPAIQEVEIKFSSLSEADLGKNRRTYLKTN